MILISKLSGIFTVVVIGLLAQQSLAHDYHNSVAQLEYVAQCECFEVSIKLETESIEAALARLGDGTRKPLESAEADAALQQYIAATFKLRNQNGQLQTLHWRGTDIQPAVTWVFFTLSAEGDGFELNNQLLFSEEASQVNNVQILGVKPIKVLRFEKRNQAQWQRIK